MAVEKEQQDQVERKEKPLNELLTTAMVDIYVGSENTHWYLHERLLCYYSPFFANIFYASDKDLDKEKQQAKRNKVYGLPDEEDRTFELLVGWLYSRSLRGPSEEKEVGPLLDLYLLSEKFGIEKLNAEIVDVISHYYYTTATYPGLRRVQYIYANTDEDNALREMMVGAVAKQLTIGDKIPAHWASALQRNGQLAVDIIRSIQQWHIEEKAIPDARDSSMSRGRTAKGGGFSAIEREGESLDTQATTAAMSNLGVESINSEPEQDKSENEARIVPSSWSSPTLTQSSPRLDSSPTKFESPAKVRETPQQLNANPVPNKNLAGAKMTRRRRMVLTFAEQDYTYNLFETEYDPYEEMPEADTRLSLLAAVMKRPESVVILTIWVVYLGYLLGATRYVTPISDRLAHDS